MQRCDSVIIRGNAARPMMKDRAEARRFKAEDKAAAKKTEDRSSL